MIRPYLLIAFLQRAHGVHGEIFAKSLTDDDARFAEGMKCFLVRDRDHMPHGEVILSGIRVTPSGLLISIKGCEDREAAKRCCGSYLAVSREDALQLRSVDEYYTGDLIGARVSDAVRGDIGELTGLISSGGGELLVVRRQGERDVLIPFLKSVIRHIDLDVGTISVELPEGLYELYRKVPD